MSVTLNSLIRTIPQDIQTLLRKHLIFDAMSAAPNLYLGEEEYLKIAVAFQKVDFNFIPCLNSGKYFSGSKLDADGNKFPVVCITDSKTKKTHVYAVYHIYEINKFVDVEGRAIVWKVMSIPESLLQKLQSKISLPKDFDELSKEELQPVRKLSLAEHKNDLLKKRFGLS